ncbi:MAG: S-layer homology domain-containing protein [Eubacteriales bacterium]
MKKILSLVLAMLMVVSVLPAVFAADDVATTAAEEVSPYQAAVDFLGLEQIWIYHGTASGAAVNEKVTRWQMALFVARFITGETDDKYWATAENDSGFTDVAEFEGKSEASLGAISFASQKGIVNGIGGGLFDPEGGIEYRQAITMIVRALGYNYKASGYPWSYINKARELGLLAGISGVGYEDTISRGVVAQLLYNAFFADVDGKTVAESVFGVGSAVVLITASNNVVYEGNAATVLRDNYVQFAALDAQGEPTGAKYHVSMDKFGLADKKAANAAVGTSYFVYYKDGCADIIYAEPLSQIYWNLGNDKQEVTASSAGGRNYVTIDGNKYQVVSQYTDLNKQQGWNQDSAGTDQVKAYLPYGATTYSYNSEYIIASNGDIYHISDPTTPYAYYSAVTDMYYKQDNGQWKIFSDAEIADLLTKATEATKGFKQVTSAGVSAYSQVIASDSSMDGYIDRITVKDYGFGQISFGKHKNKDNKDQDDFTVKYSSNYQNTLDKATAQIKNGYNGAMGNPFVTEYRWTGIQKADIPNGSYILYYIDEINREIDVLEVIGAKSGDDDDSYVMSAYVRGFDVANNAIYVGTENTQLTIGYNALSKSPIKNKDQGGSGKNLANNYNILKDKYNTYQTFVIVDGVVVYITAGSESTDYVIIDSFVSFEDDGIVANAWNTVNDTYEQIKISAFNGWTIGGLDYYLYYLSGLFQGTQMNPAYQQIIPVQTYTLYRVVYQKDGVYNLTDATPRAQGVDVSVNKYGYILGVDGKNNFAAANYVATSTTDYWMILDTTGAQPVVYTASGKLNPINLTALNAYKGTATDYVFAATANTTGLDDLDSLTNSVSFMIYNKDVYKYMNDYYLTQTNPFQYGLFMTNAYTGKVEFVSIDAKLIAQYGNFNGLNYVESLLTEGAIYKVSDNTLSKLDTYALADVANYYEKTADYVEITDGTDVIALAAGTAHTYAEIRTAVANVILEQINPAWKNTATWVQIQNRIAELAKGVTVYAQNAAKLLVSSEADINEVLADTAYNYQVNLIVNKNGTAIAWVTKTTAGTSTGALTQTLAVTGEGASFATKDTATALVGYDLTIAYTYDMVSKTLTLNVTVPEGFALEAGDEILGWIGGADVAATNIVNGADVVAGGATYPSVASFDLVFTGVDSIPTDLHIQVNRANLDEVYYEFEF